MCWSEWNMQPVVNLANIAISTLAPTLLSCGRVNRVAVWIMWLWIVWLRGPYGLCGCVDRVAVWTMWLCGQCAPCDCVNRVNRVDHVAGGPYGRVDRVAVWTVWTVWLYGPCGRVAVWTMWLCGLCGPCGRVDCTCLLARISRDAPFSSFSCSNLVSSPYASSTRDSSLASTTNTRAGDRDVTATWEKRERNVRETWEKRDRNMTETWQQRPLSCHCHSQTAKLAASLRTGNVMTLWYSTYCSG